MPSGILKFEVDQKCVICGTMFKKHHYAQKHCSTLCTNKDKYSRVRHKTLTKECQLRKRYKITLEDYNELLNKYSHQCAICDSKTNLCLDHNHKTNEIRGILCRSCNFMIGLAKDNSEILQRAQKYLLSEEQKDIENLEKQGKR